MFYVSTWYQVYLKNNRANILVRREGRTIDVEAVYTEEKNKSK